MANARAEKPALWLNKGQFLVTSLVRFSFGVSVASRKRIMVRRRIFSAASKMLKMEVLSESEDLAIREPVEMPLATRERMLSSRMKLRMQYFFLPLLVPELLLLLLPRLAPLDTAFLAKPRSIIGTIFAFLSRWKAGVSISKFVSKVRAWSESSGVSVYCQELFSSLVLDLSVFFPEY